MNLFFKEPQFSGEELLNDFRKFLIYCWWYLNLPKPTRMQLEIADFLQEGHSRMQLQALRGIGKTFETGAFVVWRLLRNPNERVLIVSQTGTHAENIAIFIRRIIGLLPITKHLIPRTEQRDSTLAFEINGCEVAVQPSVKALGITSQLQGNRATLLISDDVEGRQNSATEQLRVKLAEATAEYEAILQTNADAQIIVLGTPQSAESIYNGFRKDGYITRIFPARYPEDISVYHGCLASYIVDALHKDPSLVGKPIDSRFTEEDLTLRESRYGRSGFKLQFMLDTTLSDSERYPLKLHDLIVMPLDKEAAPERVVYGSSELERIKELPNIGFSGDGFFKPSVVDSTTMIPYNGIYMAVDPKGRGKDELGFAVVAHLNGKLFLLEAGGLRGVGYGIESLTRLSQIAKDYKVNKIFVEENFADGMFSTLWKPVLHSIYPCTIEEIKHNTQKEARIIDTLEPVMNSHRLVVDRGVVERDIRKYMSGTEHQPYSLFSQMSHVTRDRGSLLHDDILDVVAMCVAQWTRVLIQNPDKALEDYKRRAIDKEIAAMVNRHKTTSNHRGGTLFRKAFK